MCKHLEGIDCFEIEEYVKRLCPWYSMEKLVKKIKGLEQKLKDEKETSSMVHKENLELQERIETLSERR